MDADLKTAIEGIGTTFEEFKKTNDERIKNIESNKGVAELEEKLDKMNDAIDGFSEVKQRIEDLETKGNRPALQDREKNEYREGFYAFISKGEEHGLRSKAVNVGVPADGGHALPEEIDTAVYQLLRNASVMRQEATVKQVGPDYKELVNLHGAAFGGWGNEATAPTETGTATLTELTPKLGTAWAEPRISQQAIEDMSIVNAEAWLSSEIALIFSESENVGFTAGDNTGDSPQGLFTTTTATTDDDVRAFGTYQHILSAVAGGASVLPDELLDLVYSMRRVYRQGAKFMMNRLTQGVIRKLKDNDNDYLWRPGIEAGQPSTLLSYPLIENEDCPDLGVNAHAIGFGDMMRAYVIADRVGMSTLRDPYTAKPEVKFYTRKRTGSYIRDTNAYKFIQQAAA
jgi:HK97 family phage major capsid protein